MGFTADVQRLLETIHYDPEASMLLKRRMPVSLVQEVKKYVLSKGQQVPESTRFQVAYDDFNQSTSELLYKAILKLGIDDPAQIKQLLFYFVDEFLCYRLENEDSHKKNDIFGMAYVNMEAERQESEVVEYAVANHLCFQSEKYWQLTRIGVILLNLSELQATRFLLTLEIFLHVDNWDAWHMSLEFLGDIQKNGSMLAKFPPEDEFNPGPPRVWEEYLKRLRLFDLASSSPEKEISNDVVVLTNVGRVFAESVLTGDSAYDALIPLFVNQELSGVHPDLSLSASKISRIRSILQDNRLVGDLRQPILVELDRLSKGDDPFSVFKALVPCVEGILKKIIALEKIPTPKKDMDGYIQAIKGAPGAVLKGGTLQMIDKVIRPDRNITQHGEVIAAEPARMLCEVTLAVIEQVLKEYEDFQENKQ